MLYVTVIVILGAVCYQLNSLYQFEKRLNNERRQIIQDYAKLATEQQDNLEQCAASLLAATKK